MPEMDGLQMVEQIRATPELATLFIVMLTSSNQRGDIARSRSLGVDNYLIKPIRLHELSETICRVVTPVRKTPESIPQRPDLSNADTSLRILLAEDNAVNQMVMQRMLGKRGHAVTLAPTGLAAVEALRTQTFDLVFMDVQMPEMDGLDATREIRRTEASGTRMPIIALTAHAMTGDRDRCLEAGMDGYLTKPIQTKALDETLQHYAAERRRKLVASA
jgi:CheY-like chemotaxis protein